MKQWTEHQRRAIEAQDADVCVAAGAGSGKTGVLVERFVRIVRQSSAGKLPPEQRAGVENILVITFTEKATKEMKRRIVGELLAAGLRNERRAVETAYISTIHGFCARILRENPFEAGIDPEFAVLEETAARQMLRAAFEGVIERAYAHDDWEITELVAAAQDERVFGADLRDPLSALADAVEAILRRLRSAGRRPEEVWALWRSGQDATAARSLAPVRALLNPVLGEVSACVEAMKTLRAGVMGALEVRRRAVIEHEDALRELPESAGWERIAQSLAALKEAVKQATGVPRPSPHAAAAESTVQEAMGRIKLVAQSAKSLYDLTAEREEQGALLCHRFWGLVAATWSAYADAKRSQGVLDNDDLQSEAVLLLETAPAVLRRYRRRFRYLMIDEFQDTSPLQYRLVELLQGRACGSTTDDGRQTTHGGPAGAVVSVPQLFLVGDVQQSIYGFRDADATIFQEVERAYRNGGAGEHISLAANFRTRLEILQFVNRLFSQIWRDAPTPFIPLQPGAPYDDKPQPSIEFLLTRDFGRAGYVEMEANALAERIEQIVSTGDLRITDSGHPRCGEPVRYQDIAVLLRSLPDIEKYEAVFARRGIPYFVVGGGRGYYARREVRDVMNVLTVLDTPLDDVALAATLRSPMVGCDLDTLAALTRFARPDPEKERAPVYPALGSFLETGGLPEDEAARLRGFYCLMEELREVEDRLPVGQLLERIIERTEYDARLLVRPGGARRLANVRKLLQMANAASVHGVAEFIRRLREIEKLSDREGDAPTEEEAADVVRFITIHKAKGLEFPVVFLADMARGLLQPPRGIFLCDPKALALGCKIGDYKTAAYEAIANERLDADRAETARLLYVALTRAREHLILCGSVAGRSRPFNWADAVFPLSGVINVPEAPTIFTTPDGLAMRMAPMNSRT